MTTPRAILGDSKPSGHGDPSKVSGSRVIPGRLVGSIAATRAVGPNSGLLAPLPGRVTLTQLQALYRQRQMAIGLASQRSVAALWSQHINPERMADSWGALRDIVLRIIGQFHKAASADSAQFYEQMRVISGMPFRHVGLVQLPKDELVRVADSMAMGTFFHNIKTVPEPVAADSAGKAIEAASSRLALKGGRQTIVQAVHNDPMATGWERLLSPGSCGFCSMLAGRGAVYRSEKSADFQAHDHCHCTAQPVFRGQEVSKANMELASDWQRVTRGKSGNDAVQAWQQYWEARNEQPDHGAIAATQENGPGDAAQLAESVG